LRAFAQIAREGAGPALMRPAGIEHGWLILTPGCARPEHHWASVDDQGSITAATRCQSVTINAANSA
jgi:hypothetical protein